MPKIWSETIDAHRRAVRDATLETTAELVAKHGLRSVTMSQIAEETGVARATLYKYFPDVDAILVAWHERKISAHLAELVELGQRDGDRHERLERVLRAYALMQQEGRDVALAPLLHRGEHVARAQRHLKRFLRELLAEAAYADVVRSDVAPDELASYCLNALAAARDLPSKTAVHRLVDVVLAGLWPPSPARGRR